LDEVLTLERHEEMLRSGGYRPRDGCPKCVGDLHIHDYRTRALLADPAGIVSVVRFLCWSCKATWQMLPAFVARHLWRSWPTVEQAVEAPQPESTPRAEIPASTRRRWLGRLVAGAALLVVTLSTGERPALTAVGGAVGLVGTRRALVGEHARIFAVPAGQRLLQVAALVHRLAPGVRLM
jgi:hypothetical protein